MLRLLPLLTLLAGLAASAHAQTAPAPIGPPLPPQLTAQADSALAADADSLAGVAVVDSSIVARLDRLEAENDSLRDAVAIARADTTDRSVGEQARQTVEEAGRTIRGLGVKAFFSVLVLVAMAYVIRFLVWLLNTLAARNADRSLRYKRFIPVVRILAWAVAAFLVISVIFQLTGDELIAASAAAGVAIGFAAQDILKNIFGGLVIIFDQPFQVGDKVSVGDTYGEVVSIGIRSTRIVTPDDNLVSVPNSQITDGQVSNANAGVPDCQVVTDLFLPIWADEALAKRVAYEAAAASQLVYLGKPIAVLIKEVFEERLMLRVRVKAYVLEHQYEFAFQSEITQAARREYRRVGLLRAWEGEREGGDARRPAGDAERGLSDRPDAPPGTELPNATPIAARVE